MAEIETCGYITDPVLKPNEFCGKTKEQHTLLLHPFIPSNFIMFHIRGTHPDERVKCLRCGEQWFLKENEFATCTNCKQRYQTISFKDLGLE